MKRKGAGGSTNTKNAFDDTNGRSTNTIISGGSVEEGGSSREQKDAHTEYRI
ncbi:hypothetical protein [Pasteuria penetrans]|uniref:hypothetical protein n=1 Tax=Pasteuria penetrans TaxID=86005 RepID=UPI00165A3A43|nr:hypothetical protein [Pasteuria penetrans]